MCEGQDAVPHRLSSPGTPGRVFVSEYVCGGAWPDKSLETSLACEGQAMLMAILADLLRIPGCEVVTTWDRRFGEFPAQLEIAALSRLEVHLVESHNEAARFEELCRSSDAVLVIAPEFDGILARRVATASRWSAVLGPDQSAVELCSDKLRLASFLMERNISTIPTATLDLATPIAAWEFPMVVKPRDGAGSQQTFLVRDDGELDRRCREVEQAASGEGTLRCPFTDFIQQPFVPGEALSSAVIRGPDGACEFLPVCRQVLSTDGCFEYLGADWNSSLTSSWQASSMSLIRQVVDGFPGVRGWLGLDLIGCSDGSVTIVEINPRLTSSYLAWREMCGGNLATTILGIPQTLSFSSESGHFRLNL